ncbi:MAG: dihydrodipicolinate synthase family protein [Deltaproteobacteria bacterium]|nr:dihydrodipicolinate synthase family protein [Deltaproteobacteria bacterium]
MEERRPPKGLIVDLITPFDSGGAIDERGLERLIDRTLPYVQAVYVASPYMGEGESLSLEEKMVLFANALDHVQGKLPVMVWVSGKSEGLTRNTLDTLKDVLDKKSYSGPVFWVDSPLYYHSNRGLPEFYGDLVSRTGGSFIIHNDPALIRRLERPLKRANIRTGILKELIKIDELKGLIFSGPLERAHNYQRAVRSRSDFRVYDGDESNFLEHPSLSGVISTGANISPVEWQKITESSINLNDNRQEYPDSLEQIWKTGGFLGSLREIYYGNAVALIKQYLSDSGIIGSGRCTYDSEYMGDKLTSLKKLLESRLNPSH